MAEQVAPRAAIEPGRGLPWWLLLVLALVAGGVVATFSLVGPVRQTALVLALGAGLPAAGLAIARPHLAIGVYLFLIPLAIQVPVAVGLNAGELLTLGVMVFGSVSLWQGGDRITGSVQALRPILWPLALLVVVSIASLLVNDVRGFAELSSAVFKFMAFGLVALLVHINADTPRKLHFQLGAALAGAAVVAGYAIVAYLLGWSYDEFYDWNRASGTFEHWNELGGFMVLMSIPTLALGVAARRASLQLALGVLFLLEIVALLLSLTLGSIVALVAAGVFALVFMTRMSWPRVVGMAVVTACGFILVYMTNPFLQEKLTKFPERLTDRLKTYSVGISMFRDKFLLGFGSQEELLDQLWFGEGGYGQTPFGFASSVPHNSFLMMGVEKGVLGALLFAVIIAAAFWMLLRRRRELLAGRYALVYSGILVGVVGFMVQNMTNNLVLHARIGIVFFALIALVDRMARQT